VFKLLGHLTYLKAKAGGESSMSEKAGCSETAKLHAGRGPDGMVKPRLVESQCPHCNVARSGYGGWHPEFPRNPTELVGRRLGGVPEDDHYTLRGNWIASATPKDTNGTPAAVLNVNGVRNVGSPTGRET
jgi:hypothetical protein